MKCSLRVCILFLGLLIVFLTSVFFTYTLTGVTNAAYLQNQAPEDVDRVKLVPSYLGIQKLTKGPASQRTCACSHCVGDPGVSQWFDEKFDQDILPLWTKTNMILEPTVYNWWVMLQPQLKPQDLKDILTKLFLIVPGENPYGLWNRSQCRRCAVVGNSGNLHQSHYGEDINAHEFIMRMNQAPTVGFEADVGSRTTHHFMYPESAKDLPANVSFVLVPFKTLDLLWITSALSTGKIRLCRSTTQHSSSISMTSGQSIMGDIRPLECWPCSLLSISVMRSTCMDLALIAEETGITTGRTTGMLENSGKLEFTMQTLKQK
ncbi:CMP-N-acetylneuraminate-beta-galactosamide-alpha-2,3-sialyltransferase 2 isoform X2 [Mobula birostris]|uniref:CMP-N-acetylneuraminate-beta-galactosamide- alpha-2,3-sialyltransferase 2 isoform X2 n=1 Tax=Mobula birostris TaxID=1983395 RepID=UPI003B27D280